MKLILALILSLLIHQVAYSVPNEKKNIITVRAKILSLPADFTFPDSSDAGPGREQTVKPHKAHTSELKILSPKYLRGKKVTFYHVPRLTDKTVWHNTGEIIEFLISQEFLGSLFPKEDPRHTYKIPYASRISGDVSVVVKEKQAEGSGDND